MKNQKNFFILALILLSFDSSAKPLTLGTEFSGQESYRIQKIASNLGVAWGLAFLNKNELILTKRSGGITILNWKTGNKSKVDTMGFLSALYASGQGGLMDIKTHPNYSTNKWIYITYSRKNKSHGVTSVARFKLEKLKVTSFQNLIVTDSYSNTNKHFGSRMAFDNKNNLYVSIGDRGIRGNAQNLGNHSGSIIRIKDDGTIPPSNPFIKSKNSKPQIWSFGHRNPQGLTYDSARKTLWAIEHGPRGGDEINIIEKGQNYGWPLVSYGKEYWGDKPVGNGTHKVGTIQPRKVYIPSIAPGSLEIYSGKMFASWKGQLFATSLKLTHLNRLEVTKLKSISKESRMLKKIGYRMRDVVEAPDGSIFISTDNGIILRISK